MHNFAVEATTTPAAVAIETVCDSIRGAEAPNVHDYFSSPFQENHPDTPGHVVELVGVTSVMA